MKREPQRLYYTLAVLGLFALVALARWDLVAGAFHATRAGMQRDPRTQLHLLFEIALFSGIMLLTLRAIPLRANMRRDALVFFFAAAAGYCAEAWGTRTGLWTYYTREAPPLWIVPVWSLGALVIDRMTERTRALLQRRAGEKGARTLYWLIAAGALALCAAFSLPAAAAPATWAVWALLAAALFVKPRPTADVWLLLTGMFYVFFADLWGVTNGCWSYYIARAGAPLPVRLAGVGFGMLFDATVVLAVLKTARLLVPGEEDNDHA
ncbi:MAG: hypothetical protein ABIJ96_08905 [Elusimicrobiota bacterium]